jgi:predicted ATPase
MSLKRIAFSGASGTGKTTLAAHVVTTERLALNPVGSRSVAKAMGFESPYDVDAAGKRVEFQMQLRIAKAQWEYAMHPTGFVTDRTYLDEAVYLLFHGGSKAFADRFDVWPSVLEYMKYYEIVFYCPREAFQNLGDDPKRMQDPTYQRLYDACLSGLLSDVCTELQIPLEYVDAGTLEERKAFVSDTLNRYR